MIDRSIFIHSLFRAGSTYLFSVFRRAESRYNCFQESLHELTFLARDNPSVLQIDHSCDKQLLLRHPDIKGSYFRELINAWPAWRPFIKEKSIYDSYFLVGEEEVVSSFWRALASDSEKRSVFQECRTSGRIAAIKGHIGGTHLYLWRNPWDQWWSYKVDPYFDIATQHILHAIQPPRAVQHFLRELSLCSCNEVGFDKSFQFYGERPLTSEQSYLGFYLLWCLALREGVKNAYLINIDALSDSSGYRETVINDLEEVGIDGINFDDCHITQGCFLDRDRKFFEPLENRVHQWLINSDWTTEELSKIQLLRQQFAPMSFSVPATSLSSANLVQQVSRIRELAIRFESQTAILACNSGIQRNIMVLKQAEDRARQAEDRARQAEDRARQVEDRLSSIISSRSWRFTRPARFLDQQMRHIFMKLISTKSNRLP